MYHLHTCLYNVCIMYILVCTWFIPVHPVSYHEPAISFSVRSISLMNAIRTRLNTLCNLYLQCYGTGICLSVYTVYIPLKTALAGSQLSCSIFWKTRTSAFEHDSTVYEQCLLMSVHENMKMPQESWPPARAVFRGYIHCMKVYIQMGKFLYHSIVDND